MSLSIPFTLLILSSPTTSPYPRKKNISLGRCWRRYFTFSSRFSWSNLENFNFMDALYIWFLKSDIFGKYLRDVVGGNSWFRSDSIFTNMRICLCISLTCLTLHEPVDESLKQFFYQFVGTYQHARSCKNHKYIAYNYSLEFCMFWEQVCVILFLFLENIVRI